MSTYVAFWDGIAEKYAAQPVENPAAFDRKIAITRSKMNPQSAVLDIGCGTGSLALRLADAGRHIHGLDLSPEMIRIARGKTRDQAVDNVTFHIGPFDSSFTAFDGGSLDGICAYSILHLVDDHRDALARIYAMLKPGGFFISSTVCLGASRLLYGPMLAVMRLFGKAPMVRMLTVSSLAEDIRAAGFVDIEQPDVGAKPTTAFIVARKPD